MYLNISILLIFSYFLFYKIKDNDYLSMVLLTLVTSLILCMNKNNTIENIDNSIDFNDNGNPNSKDFNKQPDYVQNLTNQSINDEKSTNINNNNNKEISNDFDVIKIDNINSIGPYDGLCLNSIQKNNDYDIVSNDKLQTYLGVQGPLQVVNTDNSDLKGPTVDGDENSPQRLFMLANNKASLNCCDSSNMSTSNGCICMTKKQTNYIKSRGSNNSNNNSDL